MGIEHIDGVLDKFKKHDNHEVATSIAKKAISGIVNNIIGESIPVSEKDDITLVGCIYNGKNQLQLEQRQRAAEHGIGL